MKSIPYGRFFLFFAVLALVLAFVGCEDSPKTPSINNLSGTITVSPNANVITGTELTASYSGSESVSYQWKRGETNVGTNSNKYTPTIAGSYTVTVSAQGYNSKTSVSVVVTVPADLPGTIIISPSTGVTTGMELTASYSGSVSVSYQWRRGDVNVGTNSNKYTPAIAGSYTVTVSAEGYNSKTSAAVTVTTPPGVPDLSGTITISPDTNVTINTELTATYSGSETVSYQWEKDGSDVGTNSNKYTPTEAGSYTVTVSAQGYNGKISAAVTVTVPISDPVETVTSIAELINYLDSTRANTVTNPIQVKVNINLRTDWENLVNALNSGVDRYVALDLSDSIGTSINSSNLSQQYWDGDKYLVDLWIVSIILPTNTLSSIEGGTFRRFSKLVSITIPDSITSIGASAFYYCTSLTSVTIPDSVISIGDEAFSDCSSLASVTIGNSVRSIGDEAFSYCRSLTSITIPDSVTTIGDYAFGSCSNLETITVASGNTAYSSLDGILYNKDRSTLIICPGGIKGSVTIPNTITSIEAYAFSGCSSLTNVIIPNSVTSIGAYAFSGCTSLTDITIPGNIASIGNVAFSNCRNLTSITISSSAISIRAKTVFPYVTSITIQFGVTSIGDYAFSDYSSLTSIIIPESVISIGASAFYNCTSLTSITIPENVISIGASAFDDCSNLEVITVASGNTAYSSLDGILYNKYRSSLIKCPEGKKGTVTIPDSVTNIGDFAFYCCTSLTSITIPDSVTNIGGFAFYCCTSLTSITIPDSVTNIGHSAFSGCDNLTSVTFNGSISNLNSTLSPFPGNLWGIYWGDIGTYTRSSGSNIWTKQ